MTEALKHRSTVVLSAFALTALWAVTIWRLGGMWSALPEYSYGWSVPFLCLMLLWERWKNRPQGGSSERRAASTEQRTPRFSLSARFSLLVALVLFILSRLALEVIPNWRIAAWTMAISVVTITLLMLRILLRSSSKEPSAERKVPASSPLPLRPSQSALRVSNFAFPICFFLLAVPWPSRFEVPFIQFLTQLNATVTVELLSFLKVVAVRMGNIILIEPGLVGVQEACSGIRSFQSTLMVALFLGELFRFTWWRRILFVLLGAFFSFAFNIVRTTFLVLECNKEGLQAVDKFHDPAGWTVFAASFVCLAIIGWLLYRGQKIRAEKLKAKPGHWQRGTGLERQTPPTPTTETQTIFAREAGIGVCQRQKPEGPSDRAGASQPLKYRSTGSSRFSFLVSCFLLSALLLTELGINWWFNTHTAKRQQSIDWVTSFPRSEQSAKSKAPGADLSPLPLSASPFTPLEITKEVQSMLQYDRGGGWQWQGGGAERWQAFLFEWEKPDSLARQIVCSAQALAHQPEVCFSRAGMEVRKIYGTKRYVANGVPLEFKVYEFADRNIPIFVFSAFSERNTPVGSKRAETFQEGGSTARGLKEVFYRYAEGDRGFNGDVRVLKFGVWGPRTIGEAEAAFQQQLVAIIHPANLARATAR